MGGSHSKQTANLQACCPGKEPFPERLSNPCKLIYVFMHYLYVVQTVPNVSVLLLFPSLSAYRNSTAKQVELVRLRARRPAHRAQRRRRAPTAVQHRHLGGLEGRSGGLGGRLGGGLAQTA